MVERLKPCLFWPNCVSSRADAWRLHRIEPFAISGDPVAAFARLKTLLEDTPRTEIVAATDDYLHAACRTRLGIRRRSRVPARSRGRGDPHPFRVARLLCRHRLGREQAARRSAAPAVSERVTGRRYGRLVHASGGGKVTVARRPPNGLSSSTISARCRVATPATRLRPRPLPPPVRLASRRTKRCSTRSRSSGGMPGPNPPP